MPFDTTLRWLNLRETAGYVVDGTNQTGVPGPGSVAPSYPTAVTVGGTSINVGMTGSMLTAAENRNNTVDPRLAGHWNKSNNGTADTLRIDLPAAGQYDIRLALGSIFFNADNTYAQILDGASTVLATIDKRGVALTGGQFFDATGVLRTSATDWINNNAAARFTFATTDLRILIGSPTSVTGDTFLATVGVQQVAAAGGPSIIIAPRRQVFVIDKTIQH